MYSIELDNTSVVKSLCFAYVAKVFHWFDTFLSLIKVSRNTL